MSLYYKQDFVSSLPIRAEIKELLKSYFNSGIIDDLLFPVWIGHCLQKFRKSSFTISHTILKVCDYKACLPEDFKGVREAWMCSTYLSDPIPDASSYYYQKDCIIENPEASSCDECGSQTGCDCSYLVTHKVTGALIGSFKRTFLLRPGNLSTRNQVRDGCYNVNASGPNTFDIEGGNLLTNYESGDIYLIYYAEPSGDDIMIPDNYWVQDYIRKYLVYKCYEQLSHLVTDESFNQIDRKKQEYYLLQIEAFIMAETELKKQTIEERVRQIGVSYTRLNKYKLP